MPDEKPKSMRGKSRIMILDQHALVRRGLSVLIESTSNMCVFALAETEESARSAMEDDEPDLLIVDPAVARFDSLGLMERIRLEHPTLPILILTTFASTKYIERAFHAGINGYVAKQESGDVVVTAIRRVLLGDKYYSPKIKEIVGM